MERGYWVMLIVIALVVGIIFGFGLASKASRIPELEKQLQQLVQENAGLKAKLAAQTTPPVPATGTTPAAAVQPTEQ
jgi:uncharacterized protein YneF (UPF0154 family)